MYGIYLKDILPNRGLLLSMLDQGYIRKQVHPTEPLMIFNYTEKATFDRVWNQATTLCRGLIIDNDYNVIARPFPKFFNHNEPAAPVIRADEPVFVTDKIDGSLGIRYWCPNAKRWAIATRGSFTSDQALHATARYEELVGEHVSVPDSMGFTELFEIVYPENRIVLDYGDLDTLTYLAAVEIRTGQVLPADSIDTHWVKQYPGMGITEAFSAPTFADALALPDRSNAEGVVVVTYSSFNGTPQKMVKVKQSDYVAMHKTISNLSAKVVWERAKDGETLDQLKWGMPEELWPFIETTYTDLTEEHATYVRSANQSYGVILKKLAHDFGEFNWQRKDFAALASQFTYRDLLFLLLDERDISPVVWKKIKPTGEKPFRYISEDVQ